ncbi:hypothetical protein [Frankia sp. Cj3]|uniref:hypothetical protein n=1 Tax=Frankia sp. Cj3 TaxID=2880976 RepID=UPI001EF72EF1|nr:hypothetical protein [Frankia sp. Cj3]
MTATPRPGDQVRITVDATIQQFGGHLAANVPDVGSIYLDSERIVSVEFLASAENWRSGDVVRNASDPDDNRAWHYNPVNDSDGVPWEPIGSNVLPGGKHYGRTSLPDRLTLLVRNGRIAPTGDES